MKRYIGRRTDAGLTVVVCPDGEPERPLEPRFDLRNHSPTGFECGYGGSGPAQLSLALCADVLGDDAVAQAVYQAFKFRVVGGLPRDQDWILTEDEITAVLARL